MSGTTVDLVEAVRQLGKQLGFWNHGFAYQHGCKRLFGDADFEDKSMLEIGCGKGIYCLWAKIHGAKHVVGLEPLAEGSLDSRKCYRDFDAIVKALNLENIEMLPLKIQDYKSPEGYFDVVLSVASVNHLDERNCIELRRSAEARNAYLAIFKELRRTMKDDGTVIIVDASSRNVFGDFGMKNPFQPDIEWFKHQTPEYWAELLSECGFTNPRISWLPGLWSRHLGIYTTSKAVAYFGSSLFRLEMRCAKAEPVASVSRA